MPSPEAIAKFRDATRRMTIGAPTFTCAACGKFKLFFGRTVYGGSDMYRRRYQCAQCTLLKSTTT